MATSAFAHCDVVSTKIKRGDFSFFHFEFHANNKAGVKSPKALIIFASGAFGWSGWEDRFSDYLQAEGYEILGIDARKYALIDYNLADIQADYTTFAQYGLKPYGTQPPPLILGGWSTGAEQSVAIAGGPHPPPGLVGLLLISPGEVGGYGTYATAYLTSSIPADHKFALASFGPGLKGLRVGQWHAQLDMLDSRAWLADLPATHREYDFPHVFHDYWSCCKEWLAKVNLSLDWILSKDDAPAPVD